MRSKAHFKSHPIHPMLVAFPIAFLTGSFVSDVVALFVQNGVARSMGAYLNIAAILSGLVAGIPGFLDYLYTVPPESSAKKRALTHMIVNVSALTSFAISWLFRDWETLQPGIVTVLLEALGIGLVTYGGWLGGTLVYRNQIGVDHRYAEAGKWQEQQVDGKPGESVVVARADELKPDQLKLLRLADGRRAVLARTESGYVAFEDRCTHKGGSLAGGMMTCGTVLCPWHGSQFSVDDGKVKAGPAEMPILTYKVEMVGEEVRLVVPQPSPDRKS